MCNVKEVLGPLGVSLGMGEMGKRKKQNTEARDEGTLEHLCSSEQPLAFPAGPGVSHLSSWPAR